MVSTEPATVAVGCIPPAPHGGPDALAASLAEMSDRGVDHVVVGDHVSFFGGFGVDGLVQATALSVLHPTLPVHTSVYLLVLRHPVTVARQLSTLATLAPDRLVFGVGVGGEDRHEIAVCGVDPATRGRRMDESIDILKRLLTGEEVTHTGTHFSIEGARILPAPTAPVPIVVGGRSAAAVRRAGRLGDGWLGIWVSPKRFAAATAQAAEEAESCGRSGVAWRHGMTVWCGFGDDRTEGRQAVAGRMEALYGLPFERFERYVPAGTPAEVAADLGPYVEAGCRTFNLLAQAGAACDLVAAVAEVRHRLNG